VIARAIESSVIGGGRAVRALRPRRSTMLRCMAPSGGGRRLELVRILHRNIRIIGGVTCATWHFCLCFQYRVGERQWAMENSPIHVREWFQS